MWPIKLEIFLKNQNPNIFILWPFIEEVCRLWVQHRTCKVGSNGLLRCTSAPDSGSASFSKSCCHLVSVSFSTIFKDLELQNTSLLRREKAAVAEYSSVGHPVRIWKYLWGRKWRKPGCCPQTREISESEKDEFHQF